MKQSDKREEKGAAIGGETISFQFFFFYTVQLPSCAEEFIIENYPQSFMSLWLNL